MALTFDADKEKSISMIVETSGIDDKRSLDFTFNITVNGVKYGFPCKLEEDKVKITIPALSSIISDVKSGKYSASLDVIGDNKCFLQPFKEDINITKNPKIEVINNMVESITEIGASISRIIEDDKSTVDEDIKPPVEVKEVKKEAKVGKVGKIFN